MTPDGHCQAHTFITKSDDPLYSSDHHTLSSDTLLEYDDSMLHGAPDNLSLDSDEIAFMDLFTKSESSQDTGNMVRGYLLPSAHLTDDVGHSSCNFRVYG